MHLQWIRGVNKVNFNKPYSWFVNGVRGTGKSSFLEALGEQYLQRNHTVLDLFGSRDGEGLGWCRSPWVKEKRILLIHGANANVDCEHDTCPVDKLTLSHFNKYDILISSSPLYSSPSSEFLEINRVTDLIYKRMAWKKLIFGIIREASNLYYSRLKIDPNQSQAKASQIYLIREARHMGMALGLDTLKATSIDLDVRSVVDFLIFKSQGFLGLQRDLHFIYRYIEPTVLQNLPPDKFVILHRGGSLGIGQFPKIGWHKQEKEFILKILDIDVEFGDEIDYGENKGSFVTVGDLEHIEIIDLYLDNHSMADIANLKKRSPSTVSNQIKDHNMRVQKTRFCARCKRAGGEAYETFVSTSRARQGGQFE